MDLIIFDCDGVLVDSKVIANRTAATVIAGAGRLFRRPAVLRRNGRPKPAPDVYLLAARRLAVAPKRCLVVEDSAAGVTAAVTAGMTVLGFTGASHIPPGHGEVLRRAGAVELVATMAALPERVAARCAA